MTTIQGTKELNNHVNPYKIILNRHFIAACFPTCTYISPNIKYFEYKIILLDCGHISVMKKATCYFKIKRTMHLKLCIYASLLIYLYLQEK